MGRTWWLAAGLLTLAWIGALAPARAGEDDGDEPVVDGRLGRELEGAIRKAAPDLWGSVLVARKGEVLFAKGFGFADYAATPNTKRTLHELASASKQVAATAILHLQQRRKLKVSDTLDKFFKGVPKDKQGITLHHLLTHTSGISGNVGVPYGSPLVRKRYVAQMLAEPLAGKPGEKFEYCNVGYALLAAVVEEASRGTYEAYVEKHLFKPAGCADSGFIGDKDLKESGRASTRKGRQPGKTAADWFYGWGYRGMGGVVSTVLDLLRWDRALRTDELLEADARDVLYTPYKNGYACGWRVELTDRGTRKVHHSGGVEGYGANVVRYLEDDVCVFVLSNDGQSAFDVTRAAEDVLFKPVSLKVEIDVQPYGGGGRTVELPEKLAWKAVRKGRLVRLQLLDKREVVVQVSVPRGTYAQKVLYELEQAIGSREADDDGAKPAVDASMHLAGYGPSAKVSHAFGSVEIQAEFRDRDPSGKPFVDRRVTLVLKDTRSGGRTGFVKMNLASARQLHKALKKAAR